MVLGARLNPPQFLRVFRSPPRTRLSFCVFFGSLPLPRVLRLLFFPHILPARLKPASVFACFCVAASPSHAVLMFFLYVLPARLDPASVFACVWGRCLSLACSVCCFAFTFCTPASNPPQFLNVLGGRWLSLACSVDVFSVTFFPPASNLPQLCVLQVAACPSHAPLMFFLSLFARPLRIRVTFCMFLKSFLLPCVVRLLVFPHAHKASDL